MPKSNTIALPLDDAMIAELRAGDSVLLSGTIYTARDSAHRRMVELLDQGEPLPFDINGQTVYYMGPSPAVPGKVIGAAGPTTSGRMDFFTPKLLEAGLKGMIGKGMRSDSVKEAMKRYGAVYFAATGGAGALISKSIKKAEVIAWEDLGTEAVRRLEVENLPVTVAIDSCGGDIYLIGKEKYAVRENGKK